VFVCTAIDYILNIIATCMHDALKSNFCSQNTLSDLRNNNIAFLPYVALVTCEPSTYVCEDYIDLIRRVSCDTIKNNPIVVAQCRTTGFSLFV
jgi:hypothetical protein